MMECSGIPQYQKIADELREKIRVMPLGMQIEPEKALAEQYGVSRGTMRQAIDILVREELVVRVRGRGSFRTHPKEQTLQLTIETSVLDTIRMVGESSKAEHLSISTVIAPQRIADMLEIPHGTKVRRVCRVRIYRGEPFAYAVGYLRTDLTPPFFKRDFKTSLIDLVRNTLHLRSTARAVECFASAADPVLSSALAIPEGSPILNIGFFCKAYGGTPILVDTISFPSSQILRFSVPSKNN